MIEANINIPKGQARPHLTSRFFLLLYSWLLLVVFSYSNQRHSLHATIISSRYGVNFKKIFFINLQSILFEAHARSLGLFKTRAIMMKRPRCSSVEVTDGKPGCSSIEVTDGRPRYGHDVKVVMMQMCLNDLIFKMRFVGHVPRLCDWSHTEVI